MQSNSVSKPLVGGGAFPSKVLFLLAFLALFYVIVFSPEFIDTAQTDFNAGDFNGTRATSDGNLLLIDRNSTDLNFSGDYNSQKFDAGGDANWDNLFWTEGAHYGEQLPDNNASNQPDANMDGLVGLWHLNNGSGTTATDSSGAGNNGTLTNFACTTLDCNSSSGWVSNGQFSTNAMSFDGVNDYVLINNTITTASDYTVSLWVGNAGGSSNYPGIVHFGNVSGGEKIAIPYNVGTGKIGFTWGDGLDWKYDCGTAVNDAGWHHIVVKNNGGTRSITLDNSDVTGTCLNGGYAKQASNYFGLSPNYSGWVYSGLIDEVAIYNRALSASEVLDHYRRGVQRLRLQVRGCDDTGCSGEQFVGPDGATGTYFTDGNRNWDLNRFDGNRYFQYRALLDTGDTNISKLGISSLRLLDANVSYTSLNIAPDVNVWRADNNPVSSALPVFSYNTDGNISLDFNVFDADTNNLLLDINFSTSNLEGTGTVIINDLNLNANPAKCADLNFKDVTRCSWDWNISSGLVSDGLYYILAAISDGSLTDFNASVNRLQVDNSAPDVNVTRIDNRLVSQPLPQFSYASDGNLTIDFNVLERDVNNLLVDINYSISNSEGTGTVIINDLNLNRNFTKCDDLNFQNSTKCSWDWNIVNVSDGTYYVLVSVSAASLKGFDASDNSFVIANSVVSGAKQVACGNLVCEQKETAATCPTDCRSRCGDTICTNQETADTCPGDCVVGCGNRICEEKENCLSCQIDCGVCRTMPEQEAGVIVEPTGEETVIEFDVVRQRLELEGVNRELIETAKLFSEGFYYDRNVRIENGKTIVSIGIVNNTGSNLKDIVLVEVVPKELAQTASELDSNSKMLVLKEDPIVQFLVPRLNDGEKTVIEYVREGEIGIAIQEFVSPLIASWRLFTGEVSCQTACEDSNPCTIDQCIEQDYCVNYLAEEQSSCGYGRVCTQGVCVLTSFETIQAGAFPEYLYVAGAVTLIAILVIAYSRFMTERIRKQAEQEK